MVGAQAHAEPLRYSGIKAVDQVALVLVDEATDEYAKASYLPNKHVELLARFQSLLNCLTVRSVFYDIDFRKVEDTTIRDRFLEMQLQTNGLRVIFEDHVDLYDIQGRDIVQVHPYMHAEGKTVFIGGRGAYATSVARTEGVKTGYIGLTKPTETNVRYYKLEELLENPILMTELRDKHVIVGVNYEKVDNKRIAGNRINGVFLHYWALAALLESGPGADETFPVSVYPDKK